MSIIKLGNLAALDASTRTLIEQAEQALSYSYAPYSRFQVGAALLLDGGAMVYGANQENAAFPDCMCAERVALYNKAVQFPLHTITRMAVVARKENEDELSPAACCGSCRQVLLEFEIRQDRPVEVIFQYEKGEWAIAASASALLPYAFTPKALKPQI
jgi:cytidine deaminase